MSENEIFRNWHFHRSQPCKNDAATKHTQSISILIAQAESLRNVGLQRYSHRLIALGDPIVFSRSENFRSYKTAGDISGPKEDKTAWVKPAIKRIFVVYTDHLALLECSLKDTEVCRDVSGM
jgi:hypothetical protein